jgi:hypothetical protein
MARLTITAAAGATSAQVAALEEAVAVLTPALATLVADGASPTQAHVTAVNNAWTTIAAILAANFVLYYDRATVTPILLPTAINAALAQARCIT